MQLVVPARTAVLLIAVLATIMTDIIAQIVPSADSSSSRSSGCRFISWLLFIHGRESGQSQERLYHVDRTASRLLCEVKRRWARLVFVLRWGPREKPWCCSFCACTNDHGHAHYSILPAVLCVPPSSRPTMPSFF